MPAIGTTSWCFTRSAGPGPTRTTVFVFGFAAGLGFGFYFSTVDLEVVGFLE